MSNQARELELKITTTADVSGAEQAARAIEGVKGATAKANDEQREALQAKAREALVDLNKKSGAEWAKGILGARAPRQGFLPGSARSSEI